MTNQEKIRAEIDKQQAAGFTADEIRKNLISQQFTRDEIHIAMKGAKGTNKSDGIGIVSVLVSIYFVINGCMRISSNNSGTMLYNWGLIMLFVGLAGLIWKVVTIVKSR